MASSQPPITTETQLQQWLDQEDAQMRDTVREHGWAVQAILPDGCWGSPSCTCGQPRGVSPPFAYTVGLFGFGHPELLIYGMHEDSAAGVLNELGERVRRGRALVPGELQTFDHWPHRVHLFPFGDAGDEPVLISAQRFYERRQDDPVPALQCVWDDRWGRFPWEPEYDPPPGLQPLPQTLRSG